MAKPKDERVPMINGTPFYFYADRHYVPGDVVLMAPQHALDEAAMHRVRPLTADELRAYKTRAR